MCAEPPGAGQLESERRAKYMKTLSRRTLLAGSISSAAFFLAACSGAPSAPSGGGSAAPTQAVGTTAAGATQAPAASAAPASAAATKLIYWTFMKTNPRFQARPVLFAEFGKQHNATIEVDDVDAGNPENQKLAASFAAHVEPDILDPDSADRAVQWGQQGFLTPVDDLVAQIGKDDFPAVSINFATWKGKLYGIPLLGYPHVMHYRKDWLDQEGISPPETSDDLIAAAKKLNGTTKDGQQRFGVSIYFASVHAPPFFQNFIGPNDGYTFDEKGGIAIDSEQVFQAMKTVNTLIPYGEPGYTNLSYSDTRNLYTEGKIAIEIDSTSMGVALVTGAKTHPEVTENTQSKLIPWGPSSKKDRSGFNGITYFAIGVQTKYADLVRQFMSWFYSKDVFTRAFLSYDWGLIPERISVATDPTWFSQVPKAAQSVIKAGTEAVKFDTFPGQDWGPSPAGNQLVASDTYRNLLIKVSQAKSDSEIKAALQWAKGDVKQATQQD